MIDVGYIRVSTNGQLDGYGLDIQRETIVKWAEQHGEAGRDLVVFEERGVSGDGLNRPQLVLALAALKPGSRFIVPRLDRLARDLVTQELLIAEIHRLAILVSCSPGENAYLAEDGADPSRKLIRQVLGAVSEYERQMIRLRMVKGRAAKKARGGWAGGTVPYGFRSEYGELVPEPAEQEMISVIRNARAGGMPVREIARLLNEQGRLNRGHPWNDKILGRILRRSTTDPETPPKPDPA